MKLLVYEHISGGGCAGQPILPGVLSEGFGMLRSLVSDFKSAGHGVTVLLDARLASLNPPIVANQIIPVLKSQKIEKLLVEAAKISDAVYIIAPETGQTLQSLVELAGSTGAISLNCDAGAIPKVADKGVLYETLKRMGLPMPSTLVFNVDADLVEVKQTIRSKFRYPVVFKPMDGVSCGGLSTVKEGPQVEKAIARIRAESAGRHFIVQEFIDGEAASVSVLCTGDKALAISLNRQKVKVALPEEVSSYEGGTVPFDHPLKQEALRMGEKLVESFSSLRGYVGVDLVLAKDKPFVVDVNPRLTTSYVGLCRVANFNVAEAIVNAVLKHEFPTKRETRGFACFSKVESPKPTISTFEMVAQIREVVSPPFPIDENTEASSLLVGQGESSDVARLRLEEAKKRLFAIMGGGK